MGFMMMNHSNTPNEPDDIFSFDMDDLHLDALNEARAELGLDPITNRTATIRVYDFTKGAN